MIPDGAKHTKDKTVTAGTFFLSSDTMNPGGPGINMFAFLCYKCVPVKPQQICSFFFCFFGVTFVNSQSGD